MNNIKNKIKKVIRESNGFPNHTTEEYINTIHHLLSEEFSNDYLELIKCKKIDLDKWIMAITKEITEDMF